MVHTADRVGQAAPCKSLQPQQPGALPEWTAGGAMLVGFLGMLLLQLWQEGAANTHDHGHGHGHGQGHGQQGGYTAVTRTDSDMAEAGGGLGTAAGLTTAAMHRKEVASGGSGSGGALHVEALAAEERGEGPGAGGGGAGVGGAGGKGSSNPRLALGGLLVHSGERGVGGRGAVVQARGDSRGLREPGLPAALVPPQGRTATATCRWGP